VLRTDRRAGVGSHSAVAEECCYGMLIRIWFDMVASTVAKSTENSYQDGPSNAQSHHKSFGRPSLSSPTHLEGSQEAQRSVLERPQCASKGPTDSPREPKDSPRPSKVQPRYLKKGTKMQFAMHFLNVVRQNVVSNGFPKNLLRFLAVLTLTIVWQGQHI